MPNTDDVLVHLHVPKCAGSSINQVLSDHFRRRAFAIEPPEQKQRFNDMTMQERDANIDCMFGHVHYGYDGYFSRPVKYFSVLRPVMDRVLSFYNYIHTTPGHPLHETFKTRLTSINDLDAKFLDENPSLRILWENTYCRTYFGKPIRQVDHFQVNWQDLKGKLKDKVFVIGHLHDITNILKDRGIFDGTLPKLNVTDSTTVEHEFEVASLKTIRFKAFDLLNSLNRFDNCLVDLIHDFNGKNL